MTAPEGSLYFSFLQETEASPIWDTYILLDNQSTCHIFKNKSLLINIHPVEHPIAIHSTTGATYANTIGYVPNLPDLVYICENGIASILSFARVQEAGCTIEYNQKQDAFVVQGPAQSLIFNCLLLGLYGHHVSTTGLCLINTVDALTEGYLPWQVAAAKAAQHTMSMMSSPRLQTFKLMVWANLVNNCLVTLKSIRVADNVF